MKRSIYLIIGLLALFAVPLSIYAYSDNNSFDMMGDNYIFNSQKDDTYYMNSYGMKNYNNFEFMNEMMTEMRNCYDQQLHNEIFENQKQLIEDQFINGEITKEEADKYIKDINTMIEYHNQFHTNNTNSFNCHR